MPSVNLSSSSNMNSLVRDHSYQANGLIRQSQHQPQGHQSSIVAAANSSNSSQTSLQKLPASSSPQFVYSSQAASSSSSSGNQQQQQQQILQNNQQQHMQFHPPPPPPPMAPPLVAQAAASHVPKMEANISSFNSLIVPHSQQSINTMSGPTIMAPTQQISNGNVNSISSNQNLTQQQQQQSTILMSPMVAPKNSQNLSQQQQQQQQQQHYQYHQQQQQTHHLQQQQQQQQLQQQLQIQQTAFVNGPPSSISQQHSFSTMATMPSQLQHTQQQQQHQQSQPQQQQVPMTTIMIPATAAAQIQSASIQIQQAAMQAMASYPNQAQILVLMIPYTLTGTSNNNSQQQQQQQQLIPPTIPPTPEQQQQQVASLNSTLVRQSQSQASIIRASQQQQQSIAAAAAAVAAANANAAHLQSAQNVSAPLAAPIQATQQHGRAVSSLSANAHAKQEPEKFYIKANFSYQATKNRMELSFHKGDILHVLDTLQNTEYGHRYWLATRVKQNGKDAEKGLIPDKNKAEEISLERRALDVGEGNGSNGCGGTLDGAGSSSVLSASVGRVSFLKRRAAQRSKSLCKDNWDNVVFDIGSFKLPTYERVVYKHPGFCRPVVIFGPLADVAREKLLIDYPGKYSYPTGFEQAPVHPKVIRLKGILEIVEQGKHALLDITPAAVEKLNHVNLAPIVIFMKADSKSIIKEFRSRAAESLDPNGLNGAAHNNSSSNGGNTGSHGNDDTLRRTDGKSSKKLLEQSLKLEKSWHHVFTATLDLSTMGSEQWYRKLRETIENQQSANVWMSERKSDKKLLAGNSNQNAQHTNNGGVVGGNNPNEINFQMQSTQSASALLARGGAGAGAGAHHQLNQYQQQQHHSFIDSSSALSERFNESLNIANSKSTIDLLPDGAYGNRSQMRNAYAHSLAQKLARASSEPKLNGMMSDEHGRDDDDEDDAGGGGMIQASHHNNNNHSSNNNHYQSQHHQLSHYHHDDGYDDDDDDECIKKPFPSEFENSSSVSSSNGPTSYGMGGSNNLTSASYQHYPHHSAGQAKSDLGLTRATTQESIYSARNQIIANNNSSSCSYSNGISSNQVSHANHANHANLNNPNSNLSLNPNLNHHPNNSNYHPLPPTLMTSDNGYHNQSMASMNNNASATNNGANVIDLSRNHDTRGSAFQVYSDINQNSQPSYHYYNLNKM